VIVWVLVDGITYVVTVVVVVGFTVVGFIVVGIGAEVLVTVWVAPVGAGATDADCAVVGVVAVGKVLAVVDEDDVLDAPVVPAVVDGEPSSPVSETIA